MTTLPERLLEMCRTPDGHDLPDHAEPWGADVATLREAAAALSAPAEEEEAVECKHEWQHGQDHPGWFCCQKCDVSRKPPLA